MLALYVIVNFLIVLLENYKEVDELILVIYLFQPIY